MVEIQSLARGLKILKRMADIDRSVSVTELADFLGVNKATTSRMLQTMMKYGFVQKANDDRRYQLGAAIVQLSKAVLDRMELRNIAHPFLKKLMEKTGECSHLAIYTQGQALYIDQVESDSSLRVNASIGQMAPLHCTALGKVILAFGSFPLPDMLEKRTEATIIDQRKLQEELEKTKQQLFAIDDEEYDLGVRCIAAPVFDFKGNFLAAIGISGPTARVKRENLEALSSLVVSISQDLSNQLQFNQ